jgi:hypothetical protein
MAIAKLKSDPRSWGHDGPVGMGFGEQIHHRGRQADESVLPHTIFCGYFDST